MTLLKYGAALCALLPVQAMAQDAIDEDSDAEIVVTASGFEQPRDEVGQAVTVIDSERLEREQSVRISDILRTVPSVAVAQSGGAGGQTSVFIRGGESSQSLVLIDGVRINDPSSPNAVFDFGTLLTGNIDRVEVLRGPNSVIWGSQAIGGVVNIRNAEPTDGLTIRTRSEYGYRDTRLSQTNISGRFGPVSASFGAGSFRSDGISALLNNTERDGYRSISANGKLLVDLTGAISLDLRGYYTRGKLQFDDAFAFGPITDPRSRTEQFVAYAGLNAALLDGRWRNRLSYSRTDIDRTGTDTAVPVSFNVNQFGGVIDRLEYHASFDVTDAVTLVYGLEHERTKASSFFPANGPGAVPDRAKTRVTSGFGQLIVKPITGLTLTGGVRHDDYSQYGGVTTFGANFAYSPNDGATVLRGTYAEGFRAPTLTEALLPFGNTALKPETARSFDLGVEQTFLEGAATASATYFNKKSNDTIVFSFVSFASENIARTRAKGVELGLALRPSPTLTVDAQYSFVDAEDRSPGVSFGAQLARRPKDSASMAINWQAPFGLSLGSTVTLTGDSRDGLPNIFSPNPARLDGFVLVGLRASYAVTSNMELYGRVDNLLDEVYQTVGGYGTFGRNAYIGIRSTF